MTASPHNSASFEFKRFQRLEVEKLISTGSDNYLKDWKSIGPPNISTASYLVVKIINAFEFIVIARHQLG
jgi:hypothetical protein